MWRLLPRQQAVVAIPPPPPVARRLLPKHRARRPAAAAAAALLVLAAMFMPRNMSSHSTVHVSRSAEISPVAILRADYVTKLGDDIAQNENLLRESDSHDTITSTDQQQRQQQTPPQKQHEDAKTGLVANIGKPELASAAARARLSLDDGALEEEGSTGGRGAGDVAQRDEQSISITSSQNIEKRTSHTGEVDAADVVDAVITADTGEEAEEGTETQRGSRVDSVRGYFAGLRGRGVAIRGGARLGAADLGGAFGLSYISGAEANKRALKRLRYHDITRDARYERLRREGELQNQNHVASYTALKRGYTFVYVGRTMRLSPLRRGCFASRSLRSGDLIGEYAGRYTAIDDVKVSMYIDITRYTDC